MKKSFFCLKNFKDKAKDVRHRHKKILNVSLRIIW